MQGVQVFRTEEARENDPLAGSLVDESVEYRINLNRLVIGHDSTVTGRAGSWWGTSSVRSSAP